MTNFLNYFKYFAAVVVGLAVPACGIAALFVLMFCDHGPVILCVVMAAVIMGFALAQVILLVRGWTLLKRRERTRRAATYIITSVVLVPLAMLIWASIS